MVKQSKIIFFPCNIYVFNIELSVTQIIYARLQSPMCFQLEIIKGYKGALNELCRLPIFFPIINFSKEDFPQTYPWFKEFIKFKGVIIPHPLQVDQKRTKAYSLFLSFLSVCTYCKPSALLRVCKHECTQIWYKKREYNK